MLSVCESVPPVLCYANDLPKAPVIRRLNLGGHGLASARHICMSGWGGALSSKGKAWEAEYGLDFSRYWPGLGLAPFQQAWNGRMGFRAGIGDLGRTIKLITLHSLFRPETLYK